MAGTGPEHSADSVVQSSLQAMNHFTDEETRALGGKMTFPRSPSGEVTGSWGTGSAGYKVGPSSLSVAGGSNGSLVERGGGLGLQPGLLLHELGLGAAGGCPLPVTLHPVR